MEIPSSSQLKPSGRELFLVEGESAGSALERVCNQQCQLVLAMQGKPMNAWKSTLAKVQSNGLFQRVIQTIDAGVAQEFDLNRCEFEKVILLFDPDADGIHACSLMLWFFYRWMPPLLEAGRLYVAHPPICELIDPITGTSLYPRHPAERDKILTDWKANGSSELLRCIELKPFRGLASLGQDLLYTTCVNPKSRRIRRLRVEDAQSSLKVFGLEARSNRS